MNPLHISVLSWIHNTIHTAGKDKNWQQLRKFLSPQSHQETTGQSTLHDTDVYIPTGRISHEQTERVTNKSAWINQLVQKLSGFQTSIVQHQSIGRLFENVALTLFYNHCIEYNITQTITVNNNNNNNLPFSLRNQQILTTWVFSVEAVRSSERQNETELQYFPQKLYLNP